MNNAVEFHNSISIEFSENYNTSKDFQERFTIFSTEILNVCKDKSNILDYGCGSGVFSLQLSKFGDITAVDGAENMLEIAKNLAEKQNINNIEFIHSDLNRFKIDKTFDIIVCSSVLEYFEDMEGQLNKLYKLLNRDGILLLSLPNGNSYYRRFEKLLYKLFRIPKYYKHVKTIMKKSMYIKEIEAVGFKVENIQYFASKFGKIGEVLSSKEKTNNMILFTLKK